MSMTPGPSPPPPAAAPSPAVEARPAGTDASGEPRHDPAALAAYVLLEPLVEGRSVLDAGPGAPRGGELLRDAGARVENITTTTPQLPFGDGSFDVALRIEGTADVEGARAWAVELRRVLRPGGICVLRVPAQGERTVTDGEAGFTGASLEAALRGLFPIVDVLGEKAFLGVALSATGADGVALNEALMSTLDGPGSYIALCTTADARPWAVDESLLVPVGPMPLATPAAVEVLAPVDPAPTARATPGEAGSAGELALLRAEMEQLREALMAAEDQRDRRDATLAALRRETDRYLAQIAGTAQELETVTLERDRALRRAAELQAATAELTVALRRREVEATSAEREIAHLRARAGGG